MLVAVSRELADRGWDVRIDVLTDRVDPEWQAQLGHDVDLRSHHFRRTFDAGGWRRLERSLRGWRPSVVHTQLEAADIVGSVLTRRLGPVVSTQHVFGAPSGRREKWRARVHRVAVRRGARSVIAVSAAGHAHLIDLGYRSDQLELIYNGVGAVNAASGATREWARRQLGVGDEPIVMACAVLRPAKGIQYLVEAMSQLPAGFERAVLVIVGDGPDRQDIETLVRRYRLDARVLLVGHRDDAVALMAAADVFAHPTLQDVLPTVVIEAMAMSLPVVASTTGGVPELVVDGVTGVLVPPADATALASALGAYLADAGRRSADGSAARARFEERFTLAHQVDRLEELYERVAG